MGIRFSGGIERRFTTNHCRRPCFCRNTERQCLFAKRHHRLYPLVFSSSRGGARCSERRPHRNRFRPTLRGIHRRSRRKRLRRRCSDGPIDLENEDRHSQRCAQIGTQMWGPSGAPIWTSPVIDVRRNAVYATTGNNYSDPPTGNSDAFLAFDLDSARFSGRGRCSHPMLGTLHVV